MKEYGWISFNDSCENLDNFSDISFDMAFVYA